MSMTGRGGGLVWSVRLVHFGDRGGPISVHRPSGRQCGAGMVGSQQLSRRTLQGAGPQQPLGRALDQVC